MKNIIFDYDGTLHNTIKIYAPAYRIAYDYICNLGYAKKREWQDSEISKWLGFSSKDMWNTFMPELPQKIKNSCSQIIGKEMIRQLHEKKGELYPNSLATLQQLKNTGYNLIFLSNCKKDYMDMHREIFSLDNYFTDFYCAENYDFKPKYEIFEFIKAKYPGEFIIIGDRFQDIEVAVKHNLNSIGCAYGYGSCDEIEAADFIIHDIIEITTILN